MPKTSQNDRLLSLKQSLQDRAYEMETATLNPKSVSAVSTSLTPKKAVELKTNLRNDDAEQFARTVLAAKDPAAELADQAQCGWGEANYYLAASSYEYFCARYLGHYFTADFAPRFHGVVFPMLQRIEGHAVKQPTILAGFPECGKSVCSTLALPIRCALFRTIKFDKRGHRIDLSKMYIAVLSLIKGNASKAIECIANEFKDNDNIRDFGEFYYKPNGQKPDRWNVTNFQLQTGQYYEALSRRMATRGIRRGQFRPDLINVDDAEDPKRSRASKDAREEDMQWLTTEIFTRVSVDRGNVVVNGNIFHEGCVTAQLIEVAQKHGWQHGVFKVKEYNEDTGDWNYLWPERFGPEFEQVKREQLVLESSWNQEYMQEPSSGNTDLTESDFTYYNWNEVKGRLRHCELYTAVDPARGETKSADFAVILTMAFDRGLGLKYVLPFFMGRGYSSTRLRDEIITEYVKYHPHKVGIESVAYQLALKDIVDEEAFRMGISLPTCEIKQDTGERKTLRVQRLYPGIKKGIIQFCPDDENTKQLIHQVINVETAKHDDAADACEMADRLVSLAAEARRNKKKGRVRVRVTGHKK